MIGQIDNLTLPPIDTLVYLAFLITLALYATFSFVMYYHWKEYSVDAGVTRLTLLSYGFITLPIMFLLAALAIVI